MTTTGSIPNRWLATTALLMCTLLTAQEAPFQRSRLLRPKTDSLVTAAPQPPAVRPSVRRLPAALLRGISAANYQIPGVNEYVPLTALEMTVPLLPPVQPRPRLLSASQLQAVSARRRLPPYDDWYRRVREGAEPYLHTANQRPGGRLAQYAEQIKALAFLYHSEADQRYRDAALSLLSQLPEPPEIVNLEGGPNDSGWGDFLLSAEVMIPVLVAADLLYEEMSAELREDVRRKTLTVARQLNDALIYTTANNHMTVMALAVCTAALFDDDPEPFLGIPRQRLWENGLNALSRSLGLISPDGGYAEGVYYGNYITSYIAPFSIYMQNVTGTILYRHPYLERMVDWMIANEKGSGSYAAFDDAYQVDLLWLPLIISQSRHGALWSAYVNGRPPSAAGRNLVEALVAYPPGAVGITSGGEGVAFFADIGEAVFRDKPIQPDFFAAFYGERKQYFASRHEHIDPQSFELSAFGEDFLIDGGLGRSTTGMDRAWFLSSRATNGFLVDGLDVYRNPLYGDSHESPPTHTYAMKNAATVTMDHSMDGVDLRRSGFFLGNRLLLLVDRFGNANGTPVALNFNYRGELQSSHPDHAVIRGQQASLLMLHLSGSPIPVLRTEGFGRYTPSSRPAHINTLQLEHPATDDGLFFTLMLPHQHGRQPPAVTAEAFHGEGRVYRVGTPGDTLTEMSVAVNYGRRLATVDWDSDARALWVSYHPAGHIDALVAVDATHFRSAAFSFTASQPLTIQLNRGDTGWQGYLFADTLLSYQLQLEGDLKAPLRFNRRPQAPLAESGERVVYHLRGAGILEVGSGMPPVRQPYRHHRGPDLIAWLAAQPDPRRQYDLWSDYQRQIFRNQMSGTMLAAAFQGAGYWQERLFGSSRWLMESGTTVIGISESSYNRNSRTTYDIRFPLRYDLRYPIAGMPLRLFQESIVSSSGIDLLNVRVDARPSGESRLRYQYGSWFEGHQQHQLRFSWQQQYQLDVQRATADGQQNSTIQMILRPAESSYLRPGYRQASDGQEALFLDWQSSGTSGSLRRTTRQDSSEYHQSLAFYNHHGSIALEGRQNQQSGHQTYHGQAFYRLTPGLHAAPRFRLNKQRRWSLPEAGGDLYWRRGWTNLLAGILRHDDQVEQRMRGSWRRQSLYVSGALSLTDLKLKPEDALRATTRFPLAAGMPLTTELQLMRPADGAPLDAVIDQRLNVPITPQTILLPLIGQRVHPRQRISRLGMGISLAGRPQLYGQMVYEDLAEDDRISYQLAALISDRRQRRGVDIWLHLVQDAHRLQYLELRVLPAFTTVSPGIYYRYQRNAPARLEGTLQARW